MEREIKFRAWDKLNLEMIYMNQFPFYTGKIKDETISVDDYSEQHVVENMAWMQYTGLKDYNGNEIYEGDIVKSIDELVTVFFNGATGSWDVEFAGGDCEPLIQIGGSWDSKLYEIVGDKYSNPELLK